MTFEEFFKKKKIDLVQLKAAEPALYAEFESHYAQMGEKSFDHTKKYWFNNLRRLYHTPEEPKVEKVKIENPLAEQTVIDSVSEKPEAAPAPKVGFTPRFKAGATKPAAETFATEAPKPEESVTPVEDSPKPKVGFTPRFKAGVTKPVTEQPAPETEAPKAEETPVEATPKPKVGFTPRFKAGVTKSATEQPAPEVETSKTEETTPVAGAISNNTETEPPKTEEPPTEEAPKPKMGFTPRFKAGVTKPQKGDE